jgi:hypothetical protein
MRYGWPVTRPWVRPCSPRAIRRLMEARRTGLETGDAPPISGPAVRGSRHPRGTMSLTVRTARVEDADTPAALVRE